VIKIQPEENRIIAGTEEELFSRKLTANEVNWILGKPEMNCLEVTAKIRYKSPETAATVYTEADGVHVNFHQPQRAVSPGQAVVFYKNDEVIGGGTIETTEK
jgi:tRNA-specific 2-thiouridylase